MNTPPRTDSFPNAIEDSLKSLNKKAMAAVTAPLTPPQDPAEPHHEPPKFLIGGDDVHGIDTVPEEEEDGEAEHDTGSSIAEPVTPPSMDHIGSGSSKPSSSSALHSLAKPAAITVQSATPPPQPSTKPSPQNSQVNLKRSSSKLSSFFRRSGSHMTLHLNSVSPADIAKDIHQTPTSPKLKSRHSFFHITNTTNNTPQGSAANTPPAEVSPSQTLQAETEDLTLKKPATNTLPPTGPRYRLNRNRRASSMTGIPQAARAQSDEDLDKLGVAPIPDFTRPAPMGVGLKARRLSTAVPQIDIDIVPLSSKYASASHVPLKHKKIGSGATAVVKLFKKINCPTSEIYAVKEYRHQSRSESEQEFKDKVSSEYTLSHSLHHPNIVETVDLCMGTAHRWCAVMEYCGGGDLYSIIEASFMSDIDKLCVFKQMMRGVAYLHNHGIAHRDLKPENLIMREDGYLKITDFGSAEVFSGEHPGVAGVECGVGMTDEIRLSKPGICGSEPYLSPEVLARKVEFDPRKLDVWAAAVVTQVLFVKGLPWLKASSSDSKYAQYEATWTKWTAKNPDQIISDDNYPSSTKFLSLIETKALRRILFKMMHLDPSKRITAQQVLEDRWVKGLECCALDHVDDHAPGMVDCSKKSSCKTSAKLGVKRMHAHIPPKINSASSFFAAHKNGINI